MKKYGKEIDMIDLGRTVEWRKEIAGDQKLLAEKFLMDLESVEVCPICKNAESQEYVNVYGYEYRECGRCGHLYCATRPNVQKTENLYAADSDEKSVQAKIYLDDDLFSKRTEQIAQPKVDFVMEYLNGVKNIDTPKWVDIGSGGGEILNASALAGCRAVGVESDPNEAEFARSKGLTVLNEVFDACNADKLLEDADIVSAFNVLEHIHDPIGFFRNITNVGGDRLYVFEVPRHPSISSFLNQSFPDQACRHIYPPDHLHIFTNESINIMLNECGLMSLSMWYFGQDFNEMVTSCASESQFQSKFLSQILSMSNQIQKVIDENELGDAILMIAGKKQSV